MSLHLHSCLTSSRVPIRLIPNWLSGAISPLHFRDHSVYNRTTRLCFLGSTHLVPSHQRTHIVCSAWVCFINVAVGVNNAENFSYLTAGLPCWRSTKQYLKGKNPLVLFARAPTGYIYVWTHTLYMYEPTGSVYVWTHWLYMYEATRYICMNSLVIYVWTHCWLCICVNPLVIYVWTHWLYMYEPTGYICMNPLVVYVWTHWLYMYELTGYVYVWTYWLYMYEPTGYICMNLLVIYVWTHSLNMCEPTG
jgi:hypothetical protein